MYKISIIIILCTTLFFSCNTNDNEKNTEAITNEVRQQMTSLKASEYFKDKAIRRFVKQDFDKFYTNRNYQLAWVSADKLQPQADSLLSAIAQAHEEGLEPANYKLNEIKQLKEQLFGEKAKAPKNDSTLLKNLVKLDFMMTSSYMTYGAHLLSGRIDPFQLDTLWIVHPRKKDLSVHLEEALTNKKIRSSLNELSPATGQYNKLKSQLARYKEVANKGGWPLLSNELSAKSSMSARRDSLLRKRLALSGELDTTQAVSSQAGKQLEEAIASFQKRHGIKADGKLTAETIKWLNKPVAEVVQMIELNMERVRWLPDSIGDTYILVNTPEYVLKTFKAGKKQMQMNVIVGQEYASTPVFTDTLEYIVFSPDWTVPPSIAQKEILPILQKNPDYLLIQDMSVYETWNEKDTSALDPHATDWSQFTPETFNYRIVQNPGPKNPLGAVKFMMPNDLFIYLHDTPADYLFGRSKRSLSHGCIRLEKPAELAMYLLEWDEAKVKEYMSKEEPENVPLTQKMPVQIVYQTAWVDEEGILNFRDDIYGYDKVQQRAITSKENQLSKL
jgi:murein L,D-transpeptidase YcbB/YkuD